MFLANRLRYEFRTGGLSGAGKFVISNLLSVPRRFVYQSYYRLAHSGQMDIPVADEVQLIKQLEGTAKLDMREFRVDAEDFREYLSRANYNEGNTFAP